MATQPTDCVSEVPAPQTMVARWHVWGLLWILVVLILVYLPTLIPLVNDWINDEDMGHGFFVPLVAGYLVWQKRSELAPIPWERNHYGLVLIVWGGIQMLVGYFGVELFLSRTALIVTLTGSILYLCGWEILKRVLFPLGLLLFMIPIPSIIYNRITFPLQLFASSVAEHTLSLIGIPVIRMGNILEIPSQRLSVVEACSGIRSLLALSFLSLTYAALFDKDRWMRLWLFLVTIPIAILSNAARVTLTGVLSEINKELSTGIYHTMEGSVMYAISLAMLFVAHRVITRVRSNRHA